MKHPIARSENLTVERLPNETVVYNLRTHQAHCLNAVAAAVWSYCDGKNSPEDMARRLEADLNARADTDVVETALQQLGNVGLLADAPLTRRSLTASALLVPVITSMLVPSAAAAKSMRLGSMGRGGGRGSLGRNSNALGKP
jgi:hypothetical protein